MYTKKIISRLNLRKTIAPAQNTIDIAALENEGTGLVGHDSGPRISGSDSGTLGTAVLCKMQLMSEDFPPRMSFYVRHSQCNDQYSYETLEFSVD